jgi:hypothetical protein
MANIRYTFESKYQLETYDDVIRIYIWLRKCFEYVFVNVTDLEIAESFEFSAKNIHYDCRNIKDLKEHAFERDIHPLVVFVMAKSGYQTLAHFWGRNNSEQKAFHLELTSESAQIITAIQEFLILDEMALSQLKNQDRINTYKRFNQSDTLPIEELPTVMKIEEPHTQTNKQPTSERWYSKLFWKIFIPIAVTVIATFICWRLGLFH